MLVAPSMLSADFLNLGRDIDMINNSDAHYLHLDVMDGVFVPNISFGFPVMDAVSKICTKPLDVHLMIVHPEIWIEKVAKLGAEIMCIHQEACLHLHRTIQQIHAAGMKAGVALNPSTPINSLKDVISDIDIVLVMSVNPGFGGQSFIKHSISKVRELKQLITENESNALIEVDGGVNEETGKLLSEAGADILVAGSYVFGNENRFKNYFKTIYTLI